MAHIQKHRVTHSFVSRQRRTQKTQSPQLFVLRGGRDKEKEWLERMECVQKAKRSVRRERREIRRIEEKYIEREEGARDARINKYLVTQNYCINVALSAQLRQKYSCDVLMNWSPEPLLA